MHTADHRKVIADHGFNAIAKVVILDEFSETELPTPAGSVHLKSDRVGDALANYAARKRSLRAAVLSGADAHELRQKLAEAANRHERALADAQNDDANHQNDGHKKVTANKL